MQDKRYLEAKRVTLVGAAVNTFLGISKCVGGILFDSHALVADGIHSLSDLFTDVMVIWASKYGSQAADASHPYGHQRFETAGTLLLALFLILAGVGIAWDSIRDIIQNTHDSPGLFALPIAVISILANEILYHYTLSVGKRIQSDLISANAWHHRSDAASSLVVVVGLIGSYLGYHSFDGIAAIVVGGMIIKMGLDYGWNSVKELVDTAAEPSTVKEVEAIINEIPGIDHIHQLRTRLMGSDVFVDVHIQVEPLISVSEGHYIAQQVHHRLVKNVSGIKDVTVHVDPEDDEIVCPSLHLPNRQEIEENYLHKWQGQFPEINSWTLHYLDGKMEITLICNQPIQKIADLKRQVEDDLRENTPIRKVTILQQVAAID